LVVQSATKEKRKISLKNHSHCNVELIVVIWGRIERGEVNITVEKLYEIASAMQIPAKDLIP